MLHNLGQNKLLSSFPQADTEDLSSYFSPAFQICHQHTARVLNCRFELQKGAIRSDCKLNFLVDAHPSACHCESIGAVFRQILRNVREPVLQSC